MKLFATGPDLAELARCLADGLCQGVVVPTGAPEAALAALGGAGAGPVLVEVVGSRDVVARARAVATLGPQYAARIPFEAGGAATFKSCKAAGLRAAAFACATVDDALAAARAGAAWVTLAVADADALRKTRGLLRAFELGTELLAGPLDDADAVLAAAFAGAQIALLSPARLRALPGATLRRALAAAGS
jgi:transaldolase